MKRHKDPLPPSPPGLSKRAADFWRQLNEAYEFEKPDLERLRVVVESMHLIDLAQAEIRKDGLTTSDRYGGKRPHPSIAIARDSRATLLRALREMNLDVEPPAEIRLTRQPRRYQ